MPALLERLLLAPPALERELPALDARPEPLPLHHARIGGRTLA